MIKQECIENGEREVFVDATSDFKNYFLNDTNEAGTEYRKIVSEIAETIIVQIKEQTQPYCGKGPATLQREIAGIDLFPLAGSALKDILDRTRHLVIDSNISVYHPACLAHLHCPPFIASLAAEMIISAFNQSMDSWDQAPAATMIEQALCDQLCRFYGFESGADAIVTGGGTMSNLMGLLLARDHYCKYHLHWNTQKAGLPPESSRFRILCAEHAHFTIAQSAYILGLGHDSIVKVDSAGINEEATALASQIQDLRDQGLIPICYVTTAGTTDFGSIGPIGVLADCAQQLGLWVHVDAAFGGALMFSKKHKHKLEGIEKADSVTIDFHKLLYQPISCGAFIVKDKSSFDLLSTHVHYLNPKSNEELGILDLVSKSIQTTRRFDALKPFLAFQHIGVDKLGEIIDYTIELAEAVSEILEREPYFELAYRTPINTVVFRYVSGNSLNNLETDTINISIKTQLLLSGEAIIGQTMVRGRAFVKFTLLNPMARLHDVTTLIDKMKHMGMQMEKQLLKDKIV